MIPGIARTLPDVPASAPPSAADDLVRCPWAGNAPDYRRYHDEEWGVPLRGDRTIFEKLSLEAFQSGLSWITILRRREGFRVAFAGFDPAVVATFDESDRERLLADTGIIRNRLKIDATIANARALLALQETDGPDALDRLVWSFAPPARLDADRPRTMGDVPATTAESTALAKALRAAGFRFVGPTTVYALMQSGGLVDDHLVGCWRSAG